MYEMEDIKERVILVGVETGGDEMGTEVPPRRAFIYENATEAELDI